MPEGPEVRRMADGLSRRILKRRIDGIGNVGGKWLKKPIPGLDLIVQAIIEKRSDVDWVRVKGKAIYVKIGEIFMWNTLGMSGGWKDSESKHSHFSLKLDNQSTVYFEDIRRFGNISFHESFQQIENKLKNIGPDLLNEDVPFDLFKSQILLRPNRNICQALMDQKVFGGIGNYIKSESLYRSKISPHLKCKEISESKLESLWEWTRKIIKKSYIQGGATFSTYSDMDGVKGNFVFSFHVYRKDCDPLGNKIVHEITPDGRMTHWVPEIQN